MCHLISLRCASKWNCWAKLKFNFDPSVASEILSLRLNMSSSNNNCWSLICFIYSFHNQQLTPVTLLSAGTRGSRELSIRGNKLLNNGTAGAVKSSLLHICRVASRWWQPKIFIRTFGRKDLNLAIEVSRKFAAINFALLLHKVER